jgi:hypothetical protein
MLRLLLPPPLLPLLLLLSPLLLLPPLPLPLLPGSPYGDVLPPHWRPVHDFVLGNRLALVVRTAASACSSAAMTQA